MEKSKQARKKVERKKKDNRKFTDKTKIGRLLKHLDLTQTDLYYLIYSKTGRTIGIDRISNFVNGKKTNINIDTAKTICKALDVTLNDIID
jgi:DNA-binding Xre family transcriptional regulator